MSKRIFDNDEVYKLGAISNAFEAERDELKQRAEAAEARATELAAQLATAQAQLKDAETQRHYWFEAFNRKGNEVEP